MKPDPRDTPGPLDDVRVIELGDATSGPYAAKLLGDFGADVIKVEGPNGDASRARGPFPDDRVDPEASGLFAYLNTNKRGVVLDLRIASSLAAFERLLADADVLITNLDHAWLEERGLSVAAVRARHPQLVVTAISPFGPEGRWAERKGDDLVTYAMAGMAYSTPGMPDAAEDLESEPPLHPGCFVAETIAGAVAATATLAALAIRARTGDGDLVEVSQQAAVAAMQHRDFNNASYLGGKYLRVFSATTTGRMPNFYLPCKDGYVAIPAPLESHWRGLVAAMGDPDWAKNEAFATGAARTTNCLALRARLTEWTRTVASDEFHALADRHGLLVFPFYPVRKVLASSQVQARASAVEVDIGSRKARMPGAPFKMGVTPWRLRRPAPRLGEHTGQVLDALDRRPDRVRRTTEPGGEGTRQREASPLAGVRVLDLGQFIAMPFCTLWLAWLGAEVIAVESRRRMTSRTAPPFAPGMAGEPNASGYFNLLYAGKKSCAIDTSTHAGRKILRALADRVDVIVDNFATGVMDKLGLGYDSVRQANPSVVMLSCGAFGRSGPLRHARGLHSAVNLFSGVADVTGYEGGAPRILGGVLPDPLAGTYGCFALLAALRHRARTGEGQFIDLAMYEAMMTLIPEAVIDVGLNDRDPVRQGNRDRIHAPHGIYRCEEPDTWIALSIRSEAEWEALCRVAGRPAWRDDPAFATESARRRNAARLDEAVQSWTRTRTVGEAVEDLQRGGVPAGPVLRTDELLDDERIQALGSVIETDHPLAGRRRQLGLPWRMARGTPRYARAPLLGEHTASVMEEVLGMGREEFESLHADGVLG